MLGFGASVFGRQVAVGNFIGPVVVQTKPARAGLVGHLGSSIPFATFSKVSGSSNFTVSPTGGITLATGLTNGTSVTAIIRAANAALGQTVDTSITVTAVTVLGIPVNLTAPLIAGTARVGRTLTAVVGTWLNDDGLGSPLLVNTVAPVISGTPMVGFQLTATTGTFV